MPAILAFIPAWAWRWIAMAAMVASFGGFCWFKGNEHGTQKLIDYQTAQAVETVRLAAARVQVVHEVEIQYQDRIKVIYKKGETIEKEVKVYVTKADDAGCNIPLGFVRMYNSAWSGTIAGPPLESDRGSSGVPLSTVAEIDTHNATSCLAYKAQRDGLIEYYRKLQRVK